MSPDPPRQRQVLEQVRTEIDDEVRRQRASGSIPEDFEAQLDATFEELAPGTGQDLADRLRQVLEIVADSSVIDPQVPVASQRVGGEPVKRAVRGAVGWYVRFVVGQLSRFTVSVSRALELVEESLGELRRELRGLQPEVPAEVIPTESHSATWWTALALEALRAAPGPVLYGDDDDALAAALADEGVAVYGTDPSTRGDTPAGSGAGALAVDDRLAAVADGTLGGVLLRGSVQWCGPRRCEALVRMAGERLRPGGVLLVVSATPAAWTRAAPPVVADLAMPGRPLHPETWTHLLRAQGFGHITVRRGGADPAAGLRSRVASSAPGGAELLAAFEELFGGPDEFVVIATRDGGAVSGGVRP